MATSWEEISRMLENLIKKSGTQAFIIEGIVKEIDKDNNTCEVEPLDGGAEYLDVRLSPLTGTKDKGLILYPKKDSNVQILKITETESIILATQEIESFGLFVGQSFKMEVDKDGNLLYNGGDNGGLIIVDKLKEQVDKNSDILQTILTVLQTPINETGNGAPSSFQQALNAATQGKQVANLSSITNDKIKH